MIFIAYFLMVKASKFFDSKIVKTTVAFQNKNCINDSFVLENILPNNIEI